MVQKLSTRYKKGLIKIPKKFKSLNCWGFVYLIIKLKKFENKKCFGHAGSYQCFGHAGSYLLVLFEGQISQVNCYSNQSRFLPS